MCAVLVFSFRASYSGVIDGLLRRQEGEASDYSLALDDSVLGSLSGCQLWRSNSRRTSCTKTKNCQFDLPVDIAGFSCSSHSSCPFVYLLGSHISYAGISTGTHILPLNVSWFDFSV